MNTLEYHHTILYKCMNKSIIENLHILVKFIKRDMEKISTEQLRI